MVRTFALLFGIVFLAVGALGFVPGMVHPPGIAHPPLEVSEGYGLLLGLFPVNIIHNIIHLLFGVWGLLAYRSVGGSVAYFRSVAVIYALLTVLGLIPATWTVFGLVPIFENDVILHAALAIVAAYFGFLHRERTVTA